jgi:telomere length regulation protein
MTTNGETDSLVQILTSQPSQEQLDAVLREFKPSSSLPSSPSAAVLFVLVNTTLPELWRSLRGQGSTSNGTISLLVDCLSNVSGVNALLMRLQQLESQNQQETVNPAVEDILDVLSLILQGDEFAPSNIIKRYSQPAANGKLLLNEYAALVGGSKILNLASKVAAKIDRSKVLSICNGQQYSLWLGKGVGKAIREFCDIEATSLLLRKALGLGYPSTFQSSQG